MKKLLTRLNNSYHLFYITIVLVAGISLIFLIFPGESRFKYEFQKGSPWRHETLIAPFNFAILKTESEKLTNHILPSTQLLDLQKAKNLHLRFQNLLKLMRE